MKMDSSCSLRRSEYEIELITKHDDREKNVFRFLNDVVIETLATQQKNEKGSDRVSQRVQMIIIFSLVDVVASYWFEYRGLNEKTSARGILWYEAYCKVKGNKYYKRYFKSLTGERLFSLRNSLVHFFGLGGQNEGEYIVLSSNNKSDNEICLIKKTVLKEAYKEVHIIRPYDFQLLVNEGVVEMLKDWKKILKIHKVTRQNILWALKESTTK